MGTVGVCHKATTCQNHKTASACNGQLGKHNLSCQWSGNTETVGFCHEETTCALFTSAYDCAGQVGQQNLRCGWNGERCHEVRSPRLLGSSNNDESKDDDNEDSQDDDDQRRIPYKPLRCGWKGICTENMGTWTSYKCCESFFSNFWLPGCDGDNLLDRHTGAQCTNYKWRDPVNHAWPWGNDGRNDNGYDSNGYNSNGFLGATSDDTSDHLGDDAGRRRVPYKPLRCGFRGIGQVNVGASPEQRCCGSFLDNIFMPNCDGYELLDRHRGSQCATRRWRDPVDPVNPFGWGRHNGRYNDGGYDGGYSTGFNGNGRRRGFISSKNHGSGRRRTEILSDRLPQLKEDAARRREYFVTREADRRRSGAGECKTCVAVCMGNGHSSTECYTKECAIFCLGQ